MAYTIDFTISHHVRRKRRRGMLQVAILAFLGISGWQGKVAYDTWQKPTVAQIQSEFLEFAKPFENLCAEWRRAETLYRVLMPYYRLVWSAKSTSVLREALDAQRELPADLRPVSFHLTAGTVAELSYALGFEQYESQDRILLHRRLQRKSEQLVAATNALATAFAVREPRIEWVDTNLAPVEELNITLRYQIDDGAMPFMPLPSALSMLESEVKQVRASIDQVQSRYGADWDNVASRRLRRIDDFDTRPMETVTGNLKDLIFGGLPHARMFQEQVEHLQVLLDDLIRKSRVVGHDVTSVFDDDVGRMRLEEYFEYWPQASLNLPAFSRPAPQMGLILSQWEIVLTPADGQRLKADITADKIAGIPAMRAGFEIESINIDFDVCAQDGLIVKRAEINGLLPVVAED